MVWNSTTRPRLASGDGLHASGLCVPPLDQICHIILYILVHFSGNIPLKDFFLLQLSLISVWVFHGPDVHNGLWLYVSVLNQFQTRSNSEKQETSCNTNVLVPSHHGKDRAGLPAPSDTSAFPTQNPGLKSPPAASVTITDSKPPECVQFIGCLSLTI